MKPTDHSLLSNAEVKNEWNCTFTSWYAFVLCTGSTAFTLKCKSQLYFGRFKSLIPMWWRFTRLTRVYSCFGHSGWMSYHWVVKIKCLRISSSTPSSHSHLSNGNHDFSLGLKWLMHDTDYSHLIPSQKCFRLGASLTWRYLNFYIECAGRFEGNKGKIK